MHPLEPNNPAFFDCGFVQRIRNGKNEIAIAALAKLLNSIAHPVDLPALLAVAKGALISFDSALSLIKVPNSVAREIRGQLQVLNSTLIDQYQDLEMHDLKSTLHRRLADFQGWKTLAEVGFGTSDALPTAAVVGLGLNLGLALMQKKTMAAAYCRNLRRDLSNGDADINQLIHRPAGDPICGWHALFYKFWIEFQIQFSETPTEPEPPLNIHQASLSSWIGRAAFPSDRRRTAILDSTCFSKQQVTIALSHDGAGVFSNQVEYHLALWLIGFSGAPVEMAHLIPIEFGSTATNNEDDWSIIFDAESMSLKRDYSPLAKDAAMPSKAESIEASFIHSTLLPTPFFELVEERCRLMNVCTFGDIVPALTSIKSEGSVYPSVTEIKPTWARWARTLGALAIQGGDDAFLSAATFGDFGLCAKSKLFYATLSSTESCRYQAMLYRRLGWFTLEQPRQSGLNFGARIVPADAALRSLDQSMVLRLKELRPARRRSVAAVVDFHNYYAASIAFRWMLRLSLRSTSEFSIFADIFPGDRTSDLNEKSSQGRQGGMAAPLTAGFHLELKNYRAHIATLGSLPTVTSAIPGLKEWSQQVAHYQSVPLVRTIQIDRGMSNCGSKEVLRVLQLSDRLAPDFGRKWTENAARLAGFSSLDIDRLLRHEVRGQESTGSISEGSEHAWCMRISSALNALYEQVLSGPFHGLRSSK